MIDAETEQRLRALAARRGLGEPGLRVLTVEELLSLLDTIVELRRAKAEAYERAAKVCEEERDSSDDMHEGGPTKGSVYAAGLADGADACAERIRTLTKQQDTDRETRG